MNDVQKLPDALLIELHTLTEACVNGAATPEQSARLDQMMIENPAARKAYVSYIHILCGLRIWSEYPEPELLADPLNAAMLNVAETPAAVVSRRLFPVGVFSASIHGTVGFFSKEVPFAFLMATLLMGMLILGMYLTPVSHSVVKLIAGKNAASDAGPDGGAGNLSTAGVAPHGASKATKSAEIKYVGRVTGEIDCNWRRLGETVGSAKPQAASNGIPRPSPLAPRPYSNSHSRTPNPLIALGDTLVVSTGLLEITYATGASVALQGPCTYTSDENGGFLAVGRLTGVMEKSGSGSGSGSGSAKPQAASNGLPSPSPLAPIPSFAIATPTALVTDLGTEFGVEVAPNWATTVHVVRGEVEMRRGNNGGTPIRERLTAGQAIYVASLNESPIRFNLSEQSGPAWKGKVGGKTARVVLASDVRATIRQLRQARQSSFLSAPIGLVASNYHRVWDAEGRLLAQNDRLLAFCVATDNFFGRGMAGEGPRSSFDTGTKGLGIRDWGLAEGRGTRGEGRGIPFGAACGFAQPTVHYPLSTNPSTAHGPQSTSFVGLRYAEKNRFDRVKVFLARQESDGGSWAEMPRIFILKKPIDTNTIPPESDSANWRELPLRPIFGPSFSSEATSKPGDVIEIPLTSFSADDRTGYGWAIGGVPGNGAGGYVSVTELRGYGKPVKQIEKE